MNKKLKNSPNIQLFRKVNGLPNVLVLFVLVVFEPIVLRLEDEFCVLILLADFPVDSDALVLLLKLSLLVSLELFDIVDIMLLTVGCSPPSLVLVPSAIKDPGS
jgi:hypothetical protein